MMTSSDVSEDQSTTSMRRVGIGSVFLPSGHIYCCDPFLSDQIRALQLQVAPGCYEIELGLVRVSDFRQRVAFACMLLSPSTVTEWRNAHYELNGDRCAEFPVDAGLCCFMDETTRNLFDRRVTAFYASRPDDNYYHDVLADLFLENADPSNPYHAGDWAMHAPVEGDAHNMAIFASGLGDGVYSAHWGMDAAGQPAMLLVDFEVVASEVVRDYAARVLSKTT